MPKRLRFAADASRRLEEMAGETDFAGRAWLSRQAPAGEAADVENGEAALELRSVGPDLLLVADVSRPAFIATSLPDWPGWRAEAAGAGSTALRVETVNHAFVGIWLPPGKHTLRLTYRPPSFALGLAAMAAGLVFAAVLAATARPRPS